MDREKTLLASLCVQNNDNSAKENMQVQDSKVLRRITRNTSLVHHGENREKTGGKPPELEKGSLLQRTAEIHARRHAHSITIEHSPMIAAILGKEST